MKSLICTIALTLGAFSVAGAVPCDGKAVNTNRPDATKSGAHSSADCPSECMKTAKAKVDKDQHKAKCNTEPRVTGHEAMATKAFMASYEAKHCQKSATQAAYQAVLKATGCSHTANAAATEAARKFAYDHELAKTSCSKSAKAAADAAEKQASTTLANMTPQEAPPAAG